MIPSVIDAKTNAELLALVQPLWFPDYLTGRWHDVTYGQGKWWTQIDPPPFCSDIDPECAPLNHDYRHLPWPDGFLDGVFGDPPYAPPGSRETSTVKAMHAAYGMGTMPATPKATFLDHRRLIMEAGRVVRRDGRLVFKCSDFITSGRYWSGLASAVEVAPLAGWRLEDMVVHESGSGPQPKSRMVKCQDCDGAGYIRVPTPPNPNVTCGYCDGVGRIEQVTEQQHTRRVHSYLILFVKERWA